MKLKALFSMLTLLVGTTAACFAETNITWINPPGFRLICNPLLSTNNDVSNLYKNPPNGLALFKRNAAGTGYDSSTYDPDVPGWTAPMTLVPGEGAFLYNPLTNNYTNTFYGEIVACATNAVPSGYSIRSRTSPSASLTNFPAGPSDLKSITFCFFNGSGYDCTTRDVDCQCWTAGIPNPGLGEAFFIGNGNPAKSWIVCSTNSP